MVGERHLEEDDNVACTGVVWSVHFCNLKEGRIGRDLKSELESQPSVSFSQAKSQMFSRKHDGSHVVFA